MFAGFLHRLFIREDTTHLTVNAMKLSVIILLMAIVLITSSAHALQTFSGDVVSIDNPIDDDVFAAGNVVNINAPVDSATIAGGTLNVNAPVRDILPRADRSSSTQRLAERSWLQEETSISGAISGPTWWPWAAR
jgi:hypothetical protein